MNGPRQEQRFSLGFAVGIAALWLASHAGAAVVVRSVDPSGYPTVRATVVTNVASSRAPRVKENGVPVTGLDAANLGTGKNVVMAIDRSQSMRGKALADAASAARSFVRAKLRDDRLSVVAFGEHAMSLTSFSNDPTDASDALRSVAVDAHQGTALYDAIVLSAQSLEAQPGGRVIVALTDGDDVSSTATLTQAVAAARKAGAPVYTIGIGGRSFNAAALREISSSTGGRYFAASNTSALRGVYAAISSELARTWRLTYLTSVRPGVAVSLHVAFRSEGAATKKFDLPGDATGGESGAGSQAFFSNPLSSLFVTLAAGLATLIAVLLVAAARQSSWVKARLAPYITPPHELRARNAGRERLSAVATLMRVTERTLGHLRQWRSLRRLIERADLPLRTAELVYIMLGAGLVIGFVAAIAAGPLGGLVGMLVGGSIPLLFVSFKAKKRLKAFENQLPDLLITLAASLKAGHSFRQGIQTVVDEGQPPAAAEFRRVLTDAQLGRPMEDSLEEMAERVGSKNFSFVITCVTIQRQVGGSLASLFDMVAETVRQRQQFARKIKSLTAMGRMSAYVLVGLPFFLAGVLTMLNHSFMRPLFHDSLGHLMIVAALSMMAVGSLILKKIVSFRG